MRWTWTPFPFPYICVRIDERRYFLKIQILHNASTEYGTDLRDIGVLSRFLEDETAEDVLDQCCIRNADSKLNPVMIAVGAENKQLLVILLKYLLETANRGQVDKINKILHQTNSKGQNLMSLVMSTDDLESAQKVIVDLEAMAHERNLHKFEVCMLKHLGTNKTSSAALKLFEQKQMSEQDTQFNLFMSIWIGFFLTNLFIMIIDFATDQYPLMYYYMRWNKNQDEEDWFLGAGGLSLKQPGMYCLYVLVYTCLLLFTFVYVGPEEWYLKRQLIKFQHVPSEWVFWFTVSPMLLPLSLIHI